MWCRLNEKVHGKSSPVRNKNRAFLRTLFRCLPSSFRGKILAKENLLVSQIDSRKKVAMSIVCIVAKGKTIKGDEVLITLLFSSFLHTISQDARWARFAWFYPKDTLYFFALPIIMSLNSHQANNFFVGDRIKGETENLDVVAAAAS